LDFFRNLLHGSQHFSYLSTEFTDLFPLFIMYDAQVVYNIYFVQIFMVVEAMSVFDSTYSVGNNFAYTSFLRGRDDGTLFRTKVRHVTYQLYRNYTPGYVKSEQDNCCQ